MKKLLSLLIITIIVCFTSCKKVETVEVNYDSTKVDKNIYELYLPNGEYLVYYIIKIDECEYIVTRTYGGHETLTHKGNCENCMRNAGGGYYDADTSDSITKY